MAVLRRNKHTRTERVNLAPADPREQLFINVGRSICSIVYGQQCGCKVRGRDQCCDNMKSAARHAIQEIMETLK